MLNHMLSRSIGQKLGVVPATLAALAILLASSTLGLASAPVNVDITSPSYPVYIKPNADIDITFRYTSQPGNLGTTTAVVELLDADGNVAATRAITSLPEGVAKSHTTTLTVQREAGGYDLRVTVRNSDGTASTTTKTLIGVDGSGPDIPLMGEAPSYVGPHDQYVYITGVVGADTDRVRVYRLRREIASTTVADGRFTVKVPLVMRTNELVLRGVSAEGKLGDESRPHSVYRKLVGEQLQRQTTGPVRVYFNGQRVDFDVDPYIENGRTLVPIRHVSEAMGFDVAWHAETKRVLITGEKRIVLTIGERSAEVNGHPVDLDAAPAIKDGRTMVPLRFVSEALEAHVQWDEGLWSVFITR